MTLKESVLLRLQTAVGMKRCHVAAPQDKGDVEEIGGGAIAGAPEVIQPVESSRNLHNHNHDPQDCHPDERDRNMFGRTWPLHRSPPRRSCRSRFGTLLNFMANVLSIPTSLILTTAQPMQH